MIRFYLREKTATEFTSVLMTVFYENNRLKILTGCKVPTNMCNSKKQRVKVSIEFEMQMRSMTDWVDTWLVKKNQIKEVNTSKNLFVDVRFNRINSLFLQIIHLNPPNNFHNFH